jgi:hypothetical protein
MLEIYENNNADIFSRPTLLIIGSGLAVCEIQTARENMKKREFVETWVLYYLQLSN